MALYLQISDVAHTALEGRSWTEPRQSKRLAMPPLPLNDDYKLFRTRLLLHVGLARLVTAVHGLDSDRSSSSSRLASSDIASSRACCSARMAKFRRYAACRRVVGSPIAELEYRF